MKTLEDIKNPYARLKKLVQRGKLSKSEYMVAAKLIQEIEAEKLEKQE